MKRVLTKSVAEILAERNGLKARCRMLERQYQEVKEYCLDWSGISRPSISTLFERHEKERLP
jgi:hypothetical protein